MVRIFLIHNTLNEKLYNVMTYDTIIKNNNDRPRDSKNVFMKKNKNVASHIYIYVIVLLILVLFKSVNSYAFRCKNLMYEYTYRN